MSIGAEEMTAFTLMAPEGIGEEIDRKQKLKRRMVGTLYPDVIQGEINQLRILYTRKTGEMFPQ